MHSHFAHESGGPGSDHVGLQFRNGRIQKLLSNPPLQTEEASEWDDASPSNLPSVDASATSCADTRCDVVYALFLEPDDKTHPEWSWGEYMIDKAIRWGQPSPTFIHCELLIPPVPTDEGSRTQFSTYYGRKSAWQADHVDGFGYYLVQHAHRWRAVPVFANDAANRARREANMELGVNYSLSRYVTSVPPFRSIARYLVPMGRRKPAHCATLLARVLRNSFPEGDLNETAAYYGPATLHKEIQKHAGDVALRSATLQCDAGAASTFDSTEESIHTLLRKPMCRKHVVELGDDGCMEVVRALTLRVTDAIVAGDSKSQCQTQKQLATALLRWNILRDPLFDQIESV
tara:strand:+ start:2721 stop:3758 length:1038 start_codon:yes stop_codon:yes gene_type:complete